MKYLVLREWYGSAAKGQVMEINDINPMLLPNVQKIEEPEKKPTAVKEK